MIHNFMLQIYSIYCIQHTLLTKKTSICQCKILIPLVVVSLCAILADKFIKIILA